MSQFDVAVANATVVGRVKAQPVVTVEDLHPSMGLTFAYEESIDIAGRDALQTTEGDHEVSEVLTDAFS
jgi:hypothetical protein